MRRAFLPGVVLGLLLLSGGAELSAAETDELRERAELLRKKAAVMADRGQGDAAERLERESVELLEAAERLESKGKDRKEKGERRGIGKRAGQLKEKLHALREKGRKMKEDGASEEDMAELGRHISNTERELHEIDAAHGEPDAGKQRPEFREQVEKLKIASRRIRHLRVAAENLEMAEMHDVAHQVMEKAEAMEREVQQAKERMAAEMREGQPDRERRGTDVERELREEIERLRDEVRRLSENVEDR